ncbi:Metallophosphoesterase [Enhygromyxa salina]|uniref:Metallophosphoesterase n=1 Tax=Enhygromyxa salina TaxID=215803 RepID=A0A0C2CX39_9BACT|nr:metallophosphoesterase [Enhygromyxa salina]KIG12417.1 Metallophosphoesterase [Enhygromyxa salina]
MTRARNHTTSRIAALALGLTTSLTGCTETECATPDYTRAECRVVAENSFARLKSSSGVELRFQDPDATDPSASYAAEGIIVERGSAVHARVAHMGEFALSLRNTGNQARTLELELSNVHPLATLVASPQIIEQPVVGAETTRQLLVTVPARGHTWVRGGLTQANACPPVFRLAVLADIQTNPTQFALIIERIQKEANLAEAAGELLAGVLVAGDLTESSSEDEFRVFQDLLDTAAVPFALTPGNHDVYESHLPFYNQNFGPGNYAFDVCGAHIAMLDTGSGAIAESVLGRLPELFDPGDSEHSLAVMHHPPYAGLTGGGWSREDLAMITLGEFAHQGGDLVIAGHAHMLREFTDISVAGGTVREIIAGTAGAWQGAGQPIYGYVRLTFEAGEIDACFVEVPPPGALPHVNTPTTIPVCDEA